MTINLIFSNIGDSDVIETSIPILGNVSVTGFTEDSSGTTSDRYFERFFQYSLDGINWSEWIILDNYNLQQIQPKPNHLFRINYKYIRSGTEPFGDLILNSITLNGEFQGISQPINFNSLLFGKYFEYFNSGSLLWSNNVLEKIYKRGILAKFIEREKNDNWEDEDFIDFWWSIIYSFALIVNYGRELEKVVFDKKLLREFLKQRGLYLSSERDLIELTFLASNFFDQIRKRGTKEIYKSKAQNGSVVDGELLRLVDWNRYQEFIFGLLDLNRSAWVVDRSSSEYKSLTGITNVIKGYEDTRNFVSLSKYPIYNSLNVSLSDDSTFGLSIKSLKVSNLTQSENAGIWNDPFNIDYSIVVDQDLDYEITFFVKKEDVSVNTKISFGVNTYDRYGNVVYPYIAHDIETSSNSFALISSLGTNDRYYFVRGIIYNRGKSEITEQESKLNIGIGQSLIFKNGTNRISPILIVSNTENSTSGNVFFWDFKVRPLKTKTSRCYLNVNNMFVMFAKNLSKEYSEENIADTMRNYMIPYNASIINNWIGD